MKHGKHEAKDRRGGAVSKHKATRKQNETAKRAARERWPLTAATAWLAQLGDAPGCAPECQTANTWRTAFAEPLRIRSRNSALAIDPLCDEAAAKPETPVHLPRPAAAAPRIWQIELCLGHRVLFSRIHYVILSDYLKGQRLGAWRVDIGMNDALVALLRLLCKVYGAPHVLFVPCDPRLARVRRWAGRHGVAIVEIPPRVAADRELEVRY